MANSRQHERVETLQKNFKKNFKKKIKFPVVFQTLKQAQPDYEKLLIFVAPKYEYSDGSMSNDLTVHVGYRVKTAETSGWAYQNMKQNCQASWHSKEGFSAKNVLCWAYLPMDYLIRLIEGELPDMLQDEANDEWINRSRAKAVRSRRPKRYHKTHTMRSKRSISLDED